MQERQKEATVTQRYLVRTAQPELFAATRFLCKNWQIFNGQTLSSFRVLSRTHQHSLNYRPAILEGFQESRARVLTAHFAQICEARSGFTEKLLSSFHTHSLADRIGVRLCEMRRAGKGNGAEAPNRRVATYEYYAYSISSRAAGGKI